ncbi:putative glucuronoxylan glucuronosyltransferase F8H [Apostasia shenzhenica]|uniref:Putative glucuronoxylan glucuronosyltransferase F8H n=1 Tax=Apostasia shenzhenica TaxID=1088818 RepID=A0A2H9ZZH8_9ASPA|nr:putative glucuronoxylan glucuronosyltransferase F8H [Apostasia shenzhenica]
MAGKYFASANPRSFAFTIPSFVLVAVLSLVALTSVLFLSSSSPSSSACVDNLGRGRGRDRAASNPISPLPEYSFVASLERFLTSRSFESSSSPDAAKLDGRKAAAKALDDAIWRREMYDMVRSPSDHLSALSVIRVYVYDMPAKFTYDLLWLFRSTYKDTTNLTSNGSPVHRLIEQVELLCFIQKYSLLIIAFVFCPYVVFCGERPSINRWAKCKESLNAVISIIVALFLETRLLLLKTLEYSSTLYYTASIALNHSIDYWLWADLIAPPSQRLLENVVRVHRQEEADLFYIPFFTTISYFLLGKQQCKALYREALKWVIDQPAWQRSEGRDHILPVHHPWSFKTVRRFMKKAIWLLPDMDSTGNWYKPGQVWLEKDLILPYVPNVDWCDAKCLSDIESKRGTLLFFRGRLKRNAGGKIRSKLVEILRDIEGVIIEEGSAGNAGKEAAQIGMRKSIFCLSPAGDTPSSARLFDAIVSGCIPVIVSDELELPFEGLIDYRKIAVFVSSSDAIEPGWLVNFLKSIDSRQIKEMHSNLAKYSRHFLYSSPAQSLGAEDLTWRMIAGKLVNIKLHVRRSQRMVKGSRNLCTCDCRPSNTSLVT